MLNSYDYIETWREQQWLDYQLLLSSEPDDIDFINNESDNTQNT